MIRHIDGTGYDLVVTLPGDCIDDCSASGDVLQAVQYWLKRLPFTADVAGTKAYLQSTGGWEEDDLQDHETNLERLLWLVCCDLKEEYEGGAT